MLASAIDGRISLAQANTGSINGLVTDQQGAVLAQATVTAKRLETNSVATVKTSKSGTYAFPNLQIGHYAITVSADGFSTQAKEGYELNDGGAFSVNFTLNIGNNSEQVIVTASVGDEVNTQNGQVEHVIDGETVRDLALNGRNYLDLLGTLPGAVSVDPPDAMDVITTGSTVSIILNGARGTSNGLYVDGTINKDIGSNATQFNNIGIDFIEHVSAQTSSYSSQWGDSGGPVINVVTRSGTNTIHGSLFENIRNNYLDAVNYFSKKVQTDGSYKPVVNHLRFNDFGGALGLPLKHDKIFLFTGSEWKTIAQNTTPTGLALPPTQFLKGNFLNTEGKCSLTSQPSVGLPINQTTCDISKQITPFGRSLQQIYQTLRSKAASFDDTVCIDYCYATNTIFELPNPYLNREHIVRADWVFNGRNSAYGRWVNDTHRRTNPLGSGSLPTSSYHEHVPANNALLSYTHLFSSNIYNEVSGAALWSSIDQTPVGEDWEKSYYGLQYEPIYPQYVTKLGLPSIAMRYASSGTFTTLGSEGNVQKIHTTYLQGRDLLTLVHGAHTVKVGGLFSRYRKDLNNQNPNLYGAVAFYAGGTNSVGNGIADALLGNFYSYTESAYDTFGMFRLSQASAFVDDTWRVASKLSLNWGVRAEWNTPWKAQADNLASFFEDAYAKDVAVNGEVTVNRDGTISSTTKNRYNGMRRAGDGVPASESKHVPNANDSDVLSVKTDGKRGFYSSQLIFAPRFGFAYNIFNSGETSLRGGVGLFFDTPQANVAFAALNTPPYQTSETVRYGNIDNLAGYAAQALTRPLSNMTAVSPDLKRGQTYQYNLGLQQKLPAGVFLEVNYIGSRGSKLLHMPDINGPAHLSDEQIDYNASPTTYSVDSDRKYHGYEAIYRYESNASANYNGLQANMNRRVGKVRLTFAYTWSKALTTASADTETPLTSEYPSNYFYGYASFDRRQLFSTTYSITTPTFARHKYLLGGPLGNWMLTGISRYQSGAHLTPTTTVANVSGVRASYAGYPVLYHHKQWDWWESTNPGGITNFYAPAVGAIGNSPKGIIVGPNLFTSDLSARKTFNVAKRYRVLVNLDAFNILNHPQLSNPTVALTSATNHYFLATSAYGIDYSSLGITSAGRSRNLQGGIRLTF